MSYVPPPVPPSDPSAEANYATPARPGSGMALTSMILGIVAVPLLCVFGLGILPGIAALILGIIALVQISKNPYKGRQGMAIAGTVLGGFCTVGAPLLIAILIPSLGRAKELANRSACGASLTGIMKAAALYSASNTDQYPVVFPPSGAYTAPSVTGGAAGIASSATTVMEGYYNSSHFAAGDPMACLWILVLSGNVSPKQFICKSDPAAPRVSDQTDPAGNYYYSFGEAAGTAVHETYSYSIAYPWAGAPSGGLWNVGSYWRNTVDSSLPIASDMAPMNGTGTYPMKNVTTPKNGPGAPKVYNSNNHSGGEGQNVVFADTHVEFTTSPYVGQSGDNIWTTGWGSSQGAIATQGTLPAYPSNSVPYDLIFVPVRNASTNMQ